jgi:hypothetical protein
VTLGAAGVDGVTVTATGAAGNAAATTDANGNYTIISLADGDYTVSAAKPGYTCTPTSSPVTISGANVTAVDFVAAGALSISGAINENGVTLTLGGDGSDTTTSSGGTYSFTDLVPGNYTVTPSLAGYIFSADWSGTLTDADVTNANFTATPVYVISGAITNSVTSAPIPGVAVDLSGDDVRSTATAIDGTYAFVNVPDGSYTVTPGLTDYTFAPINNAVAVSGADESGVDFTGTFTVTYSVSGRITYDTGSGVIGLEGVTVDLSGDATGSVTTDASGDYAFAGLADGGNFTVTPSLAGYSFGAPWSGTLIADVTNADFAATGSCYTVSGSVWILGTGGPLSGATMTLDTTPALTATTTVGGSYSTACVPNGTYTLTPSLSGPSAVFFPAEKTITIAGVNIWGENFDADVRYSVEGTVSYGGSETGRVYLNAERSGGGSTGVGTSIDYPTENTFIINGVQPGDYTITAFMDHLGGGTRNASNPTGATGTITVSGDVTGQAITLSDPSPVTPAVPDGIMAYPTDGAALVFWDTPTSADLELAESYNLYWSTSAGVSSTTYDGTASVPAMDDGVYMMSGLTNGNTYYFTVTAVTGGVISADSPVSLPVTIGATTGANTVSGAITFSEPSPGPMFVGLYQENSGGAPDVYVTRIASPASPQAYSVGGVPAGSYYFFAIIDMNNNGLIDAGDIENTDEGGMITVSGNMTHNLTLASANAFAEVATGHGKNASSEWYSLNMEVDDGKKRVVKATLNAGPNVAGPIDMGKSEWGGHSVWVDLRSQAPKVGDSYTFDVTYSDGSTESFARSVTAVLESFPTPTYPVGSAPGATHPTFTWTAPASPPASYTYNIRVNDSSWNEVWSPEGDMPSTQTSVEFNVDGNASQDPLTGGTTYNWDIEVRDDNGNRASNSVQFTP